uniref:Uncharacterized protein n=1 Tax=Sphaerodactylus townsendi TaxID=933632 RepID=A0ACB8FKX9_9SAUR
MPTAWPGALGLWRLAVFLSYLVAPVGASENFDLQCYTDFATEVVCHWDAEGATDCAKTFRVNVYNNAKLRPKCVPENRRIPEFASPRCFCRMNGMKETDFGGTEFTLSLGAGTKKSKNTTVKLDNIAVKPRPPINLTVTKSSKRSFVLNWTKDYGPDSHIRNIKVLHQVRISSEGSEQPELRNITEQAEHCEIFAQSLLPGENYTVWVRYRLADWGGFWSEWSSPVTLINNFKPESGDTLWRLILLICFLVLVLVPASFFCWISVWLCGRCSRGPKERCHSGPHQRISWETSDGATCSGRLDKAVVRVPTCLIPEAPPVESPLTICTPEAASGPGAQTEDEEDHIPRHDALTDLFLDILGSGGSAEGAEAPDSALGESPPDSAPKLELEDLCLFGGTPQKNPSGSCTSGYQNSVVSASSRAASPALEQPRGGGQSFSPTQYKSLVFPHQLSSTPYPAVVTDRKSPQAPTSQPPCYKSFSSLVGLPTASVHPPWKHQLDFPGVDQAQVLTRWPPSCVEGLFSPPQQEAPSQNAPDIPCLAGYRPFKVGLLPSTVSQDPGCLSSGSPQDPHQGAFQGIPDPILRTWEAETGTWPGASWEEPLAFDLSPCTEEEEQDSCQGGFRQGTEGFLPRLPVAPF